MSDFNKPGRRMRIQAGLGVLLGLALIAYLWHAQRRATQEIDRALKEDIPRALVDELVRSSCRDPASQPCLDLVRASFSNGGNCDLSRPRIDAAWAALRSGASYPPELREAWQRIVLSCQKSTR